MVGTAVVSTIGSRWRVGVGLAALAVVVMAASTCGPALGTAQTSEEPLSDLSPVGLDRVEPLVQTGRWVWMGDSFAVPAPARVGFAALRVWPLDRVGAVLTGPSAQITRLAPTGGRAVASADGYALGPGTPRASRMGLPVFRLMEWDLPAGETALGSVAVWPGVLADGHAAATGGLFADGATIRPLLYAEPGAPTRGTVRLDAARTSETPVPVGGFALGAEAALADAPQSTVPLAADLDAAGPVHLAGLLLAGAPGHYAQFLADGSWSYWGFGSDADPAPPDSVKRFRTDDLADYLRATTLDPDQPTVVPFYLAQERPALPRLRRELRAAVDQIRAAFDRADLPAPVVLLIHPHAIASRGVRGAAQNERSGTAMREIALADPDVAFVSLYDATDGIVFDGRAEARDWLAANGYAELAFGTRRAGADGPLSLRDGALLFGDAIHPTVPGAAFFATVLGRLIRGESVAR